MFKYKKVSTLQLIMLILKHQWLEILKVMFKWELIQVFKNMQNNLNKEWLMTSPILTLPRNTLKIWILLFLIGIKWEREHLQDPKQQFQLSQDTWIQLSVIQTEKN